MKIAKDYCGPIALSVLTTTGVSRKAGGLACGWSIRNGSNDHRVAENGGWACCRQQVAILSSDGKRLLMSRLENCLSPGRGPLALLHVGSIKRYAGRWEKVTQSSQNSGYLYGNTGEESLVLASDLEALVIWSI
jgi:hypothetical protein